MQNFVVRITDEARGRLEAAAERSEDDNESASSIARRAIELHLDRLDAHAEVSRGEHPAVQREGVPTEVAALLRFVVRTDTLSDAHAVVDHALTLATSELRAAGADDEIEVVGPWLNRSSWAWDTDVPPPVTLHFIGDSCPDHVHWRWNGITVDGMTGVLQPPEFESSPTTLRVRLPGIAVPLALGLSWRDPHWYVDWDGTHSQVLAAIRPVGQWSEPAEVGQITGPLGQLGPVRIVEGERTTNPAEGSAPTSS